MLAPHNDDKGSYELELNGELRKLIFTDDVLVTRAENNFCINKCLNPAPARHVTSPPPPLLRTRSPAVDCL